jgi:hypothetical protein
MNNTREREQQIERERLEGQRPSGNRLTTADLARAPDSTAAQANAQSARPAGGEAHEGEASQPLFPPNVLDEFNTRWTEVQAAFVDTPREAVERADELVAHAIKRLAESFSTERAKLEEQWSQNGDVSTEDLRIALQRYRSFFHRLLHL